MDFHPAHESSPEDRQLQLENEARRRELETKYGAVFTDVDEVPAMTEAEWLRNMLLFEEQIMSDDYTTISAVLGHPTTYPVAMLTDAQVDDELEQLFDLFADHRIQLDCLCNVEPRELYRFIVEEFLDEEFIEITAAGDWWTVFIYEEYHPNDEYDAKMWSEMFLIDLLMDKNRSLHVANTCDQSAREANVLVDELAPRMMVFWAHYAVITERTINCLDCKITGDTAVTELSVTFTGLLHGCCDPIRTTGRAVLRLARSPYGGWDVIRASVPGIVI
ncbi:MAG: hypothetical protein IPK16_16460 [Anaerolineales bacterium]|nr:hypothetical protein [Anaerolineales bacterium]